MLNWRGFIRTFCYVAVGFAVILYLFILLVDPYDSVPFSLPLDREPISTNQRFAYPSLARNPSFNSAIIGTSTARLLKPERLNRLTGDSWVNLAMNSATAYEQMEVLKLFLRHHPNAKAIVIGIDDAWCNPSSEIQKFTFRPFPPWMYDDNRWNDLLYLFNDKALENSVRLIEYWSGKRKAKYDRTGYRDFTAEFGKYDSSEISKKLYPHGQRPKVVDDREGGLNTAFKKTSEELISDFGSHRLIVGALAGIPPNTEITLLFMPLHGSYLKNGENNYTRCKSSMFAKTKTRANIRFIDRMRIDKLTLYDDNYWDPIHFRNSVGKILEKEISRKASSSP